MSTHSTLAMVPLFCFAIALSPGSALAQQKQQVSLKSSTENNKITQQQNVEVGDVPNHIVRVYEVHRTFPNNPPMINGLKIVDEWDRGTIDLIDGHGGGPAYIAYVLENGDKVFVSGATVVQSAAGKLTATTTGHITGGTGKLGTIQGVSRGVTNFDYKTGFTENQSDLEYSVGK
jgi:hypothetical protein